MMISPSGAKSKRWLEVYLFIKLERPTAIGSLGYGSIMRKGPATTVALGGSLTRCRHVGEVCSSASLTTGEQEASDDIGSANSTPPFVWQAIRTVVAPLA